MPGEASPRFFFPWRGTSPREGTKPKAWRGLQPRGGSFLAKCALSPRQGAHGLCVLRRVTGAPACGDDSAVVAILVYKAVNKAAPRKGGPRLATLVIRRPSDAADEGDVTVGVTPSRCSASPPSGWPVAFPALGTPPSAMDRVHGLYLYRAPHLLLRRHVVALPAKTFGGKRPEMPI